MGTQLPPKGYSPQFSAHVCCGQTAGWIKVPLGTEIGLVLHGTQLAPLPQNRDTAAPVFGPCLFVCCDKMDGWIKMPLAREVDLGPGDIILDEDPASFPKGTHTPIFGPCLLWPNGRPSQLLLSTCCAFFGFSIFVCSFGLA